jgi:hypothetical protein
VLPLAALAVSLALPAAEAGARTKTVTVTGELIVQNGQRPTDPGNCSAIGFGRWKDVPGTIGARVTKTSVRNGKESSDFFKPPFSDTYTFIATYKVEPGYHWGAISHSWSDGPRANDCSASAERVRALYLPTVKVELTIEVDEKACKAAQAKVTKRKRAVSALQAKVSGAKGARKQRLKRQLKAAKQSRDKAVEAAAKAC